jgi:hypothetical protein
VNIQKLSDLNNNRYCEFLEGAKHNSETGITKTKMADAINVKVCMLY